MIERIVTTQSNEATSALFGAFDINARLIEKAFDVIKRREPAMKMVIRF